MDPPCSGADAGGREEISRAMAEGQSIRSIAAKLVRAPSTISRDLRRNGGREAYRAIGADRAAWDRALLPRCCKLARDRALAMPAISASPDKPLLRSIPLTLPGSLAP